MKYPPLEANTGETVSVLTEQLLAAAFDALMKDSHWPLGYYYLPVPTSWLGPWDGPLSEREALHLGHS